MNIGIVAVSGLAGAGKSALCRSVIALAAPVECVIAPVATEIKKIATMSGWDGSKDEKGRKLLQDLGTPFRDYYKHLWIWKWMQNFCDSVIMQTSEYMQFEDPVGPNPVPTAMVPNSDRMLFLIDDMRSPKELEFFRCLGGVTVRITGRATTLTGEAAMHETEKYGESLEVHAVVPNRGTLGELAGPAATVLHNVKYSPFIEIKEAAIDFFLDNACPVT